ncbi:MAG: LysM peptidoglycan-binding domain-containing protein, partial [Actinomycetota bacterium]
VVWALWAYLVLVVALSALGQLAASLRPGRAVPGIFRFRNAVVPASLQLVLDTLFIAAIVAPQLKAPTSVRTLPATPAVAQPAASPPAPATLLAQLTTAPAPTTPTYTVKRGDSLSSIAEQECGTGNAWPALARANQATVSDPDLIHAGDVLRLPAECDPAGQPVESAVQVHVVQPGETLWSIAVSVYGDGSKAAAIFDANAGQVVGTHGERLERPRFIEAGWRLVLPPGVVGTPAASPAPAPAVTAPAPPDATPPVSTPPVPPPPAPSASPAASPSPSPVAASPPPSLGAPAAAGPVGGPGDPAGTARPPQAPDPAARGPVAGRRGRTHGAPVRLPGGWVIPASLGAVLLALVARARARKLRDARLDARALRVADEGPVLTGVRRAGVGASFDALGALAEPVLRAWASGHEGRVPAVVACWESAADTAFLLDEPDPGPLPEPRALGEMQIRFEAGGGGVWAVASGSGPARLRRGINAFADGLLVPVGNREQDAALHLPLFGPLLSVAGAQAAAVIEAMVLAARARCSPDDLSIVVVGDDDLLADTLGGGDDDDGDLPAIRRVAIADQEQMRLELEAQVLANATTISDYGLSDIGRHALEHPDDRVAATLIILHPAVAPAWLPLLTRGRRLGLAGVVAGECAAAQRSLTLDDDGSLSVACPGLDTTVISPCVLPPGTIEELATVLTDQPEDPDEYADVPVLEELPADEVAAPTVRIQLFGSLQVINATGEVIAQPGRNRRSTRDVLAYL